MSAYEPVKEAITRAAAELLIEPPRAVTLLSHVEAAFPDEWLSRKGLPRIVGSSDRREYHPINLPLTHRGHQQLAALMELGCYLESVQSSPVLEQLHAQLRDPGGFAHTQLQLAFGHRLSLAGAEEVVYEPNAADSRRGDLLFTWEGIDYAVECFRPRENPRLNAEAKLLHQQCQDVAGYGTVSLRVIVQLLALPTASQRIAIVNRVRRMMRAVRKALQDGITIPDVAEELEGEVARVAVDLYDPPQPEEGSLFMAARPRDGIGRHDIQSVLAKVKPYIDEHGQKRIERGAVTTIEVRSPLPDGPEARMDHESHAEKLAGKLEKKLGQARMSDGRRRLLVVDTALAGTILSAGDQRIRTIRKRLTERHQGVAGVLLLHRVWDRQPPRWKYRPIWIPAAGEQAVPARLSIAISRVEAADILAQA